MYHSANVLSFEFRDRRIHAGVGRLILQWDMSVYRCRTCIFLSSLGNGVALHSTLLPHSCWHMLRSTAHHPHNMPTTVCLVWWCVTWCESSFGIPPSLSTFVDHHLLCDEYTHFDTHFSDLSISLCMHLLVQVTQTTLSVVAAENFHHEFYEERDILHLKLLCLRVPWPHPFHHVFYDI